MKRILLALTLATVFSLTGCGLPDLPPDPNTPPPATVPVGNSVLIADPAQNAKFVSAVNFAGDILSLGGSLALKTYTSGADQVAYAKLLSGSGHVFESLETGSLPTDDQIKNSFSAYFPATAGNYVNIANGAAEALSVIRDGIASVLPAGLQKSNPGVYAAYVNYALAALAKIAYSTADPYLTA